MSSRRRISTNAVYQLLAQAGVLALNLVASPVIVTVLRPWFPALVGITTNYFGSSSWGSASDHPALAHHQRGEASELRAVFDVDVCHSP